MTCKKKIESIAYSIQRRVEVELSLPLNPRIIKLFLRTSSYIVLIIAVT